VGTLSAIKPKEFQASYDEDCGNTDYSGNRIIIRRAHSWFKVTNGGINFGVAEIVKAQLCFSPS